MVLPNGSRAVQFSMGKSIHGTYSKFPNFKNSEFLIFKISEIQNFKLHGPTSILEHQKKHEVVTISILDKYIGKSSSRKLRWLIYYTLYGMDPQKNILKHIFARKYQKSKK